MSGWQTMESAPKDGTRVLIRWRFGDEERVELAAYDGEVWWWNGGAAIASEDTPTHWQPLPEPPANDNPTDEALSGSIGEAHGA